MWNRQQRSTLLVTTWQKSTDFSPLLTLTANKQKEIERKTQTNNVMDALRNLLRTAKHGKLGLFSECSLCWTLFVEDSGMHALHPHRGPMRCSTQQRMLFPVENFYKKIISLATGVPCWGITNSDASSEVTMALF